MCTTPNRIRPNLLALNRIGRIAKWNRPYNRDGYLYAARVNSTLSTVIVHYCRLEVNVKSLQRCMVLESQWRFNNGQRTPSIDVSFFQNKEWKGTKELVYHCWSDLFSMISWKRILGTSLADEKILGKSSMRKRLLCLMQSTRNQATLHFRTVICKSEHLDTEHE
jgi:hypothetical protein